MTDVPTTEAEWRERLTPEQFHILREKGTERAFTGTYWDEHGNGVYRCAGCGAELFSSDTKFDSGTGWPSFTEPLDPARVHLETDSSYGMTRTEATAPAAAATWATCSTTGRGPRGSAGASTPAPWISTNREVPRRKVPPRKCRYLRSTDDPGGSACSTRRPSNRRRPRRPRRR